MIDVSTTVSITCDVCGKGCHQTGEKQTIKETKEYLRKDGWTFGKITKCPVCNHKKGKDYLFDNVSSYPSGYAAVL